MITKNSTAAKQTEKRLDDIDYANRPRKKIKWGKTIIYTLIIVGVLATFADMLGYI